MFLVINENMRLCLYMLLTFFKQHENPLCICYSTQKSDIGTVVGLGNIFNLATLSKLALVRVATPHLSFLT